MTSSISARIAIVLVVIAAALVILRLPTTTRQIQAAATRNDAFVGEGGILASADSLDIDNAWVVAALDTVPEHATYAVAQPPHTVVEQNKLSEVTYDALAAYMRYTMLPRRPVELAKADYILCYGCTIDRPGIRWIWVGGADSKLPGLRVGHVVSR